MKDPADSMGGLVAVRDGETWAQRLLGGNPVVFSPPPAPVLCLFSTCQPGSAKPPEDKAEAGGVAGNGFAGTGEGSGLGRQRARDNHRGSWIRWTDGPFGEKRRTNRDTMAVWSSLAWLSR